MGPNGTGGGQNPFLQILSQMQGAQSGGFAGGPKGPAGASPLGGTPPAGGQPTLQGGTPGGAALPGGQPGGAPGQQQPGSNATKMLIGALQNLHTFALQALDPQEAQLVRQIIVLLSSLIQREQARQLQSGGAPIGGQAGGQPGQPAGMIGR